MSNIKIEDIMSDHPIKVKEDATVGQVAHLLLRYRINGVLVVNKSNDQDLRGIFTTTDLLRLINQAFSKMENQIQELQKISSLPVGKFCSKNIVSISKDAPVMEAMELMLTKNIHTVPVYDKDKLVGVIGKHDLLNIVLN